ncbi:MAG: hypothetical protein US42_C0001G0039 [Candidatus Magasanikbacteria bacterium GW2011_GWC2_37_14]|uniref:Uncharacterized protein n=1 Tax=Candidatus Magasanikbacteria bacterium GW2011_GWC2_37_14 TaxID=1619046 RepID=A0A0G0GAR4_9BACT|nr:MAG: hypothetical protein US42_C0001G0039 [Candidatus Magasanikbacteria bacterium GW2011_GWC2_37_14]
MRKLFYIFIITFLLGLMVLPNFVLAQTTNSVNKVEYTLFHLETCTHCQAEIKFLNEKVFPLYGQYLDFHLYEVSGEKNAKLFEEYGNKYFTAVGSVPVAFIDGTPVSGYGTDKTTGKEIIQIIEQKLQTKGLIQTKTTETINTNKINIPILGEINPKTFSLPLLTVIIGLLDGFNPCAMWALLFLITLLLGMENRKRMWLLGSLFIVASGAVYFVFMAAWLQLLLFLGMIATIRIVIGLVAIGAGGINLREWWLNRKAEALACKVSDLKDTKKTFEKIKAIVYRKSLLWSIVGILLLGFSVNLVELACSAGFPAVYTQVLALSGLPMWQKYLYMVGYIVFYMLDDMIVFVIAMVTLKSKVVGGKYGKYSALIGGILMLLLGLLLIFKPSWLMFG